MKVHHLDCACMCPPARRAVSGDGSLFERGAMPAHCLLIETPSSGLVLVDTGFGLDDVREPSKRLGAAFSWMMAVKDAPEHCAISQVKKLGHDPRDVRHVLVTHLDLDHAGGLPDFPWAKVHLHATERDAALHPHRAERMRYRPAHFAHRPDFVPYDHTGEPWNGFPVVRSLPGLPPEILAIPLPGHSRGHACIAVDRGDVPNGDRWLVHAGDAYFSRASIEGRAAPWGLRLFERLVGIDYRKVLDNHRRLGELAKVDGVSVLSAHDPDELSAHQAQSRS